MVGGGAPKVGADGRKFLKITPSRLPKTGLFKAFEQKLAESVNFPFALKKMWSGQGPVGLLAAAAPAVSNNLRTSFYLATLKMFAKA